MAFTPAMVRQAHHERDEVRLTMSGTKTDSPLVKKGNHPITSAKNGPATKNKQAHHEREEVYPITAEIKYRPHMSTTGTTIVYR